MYVCIVSTATVYKDIGYPEREFSLYNGKGRLKFSGYEGGVKMHI